MIFTVPSDTKTPCFDSWKTETNCLAQGGGVDMRNPVLVADPPIGKVEALPGDIAVRVRGVVCGEPSGE